MNDKHKTDEAEQQLYAAIMEATQDLHNQKFPITSIVNVLCNALYTLACNFSPHTVGPAVTALAKRLASDAVQEDQAKENPS